MSMFPHTDGSWNDLSFKLNILKAKTLLLPMTWQLFSIQQPGAAGEVWAGSQGSCCSLLLQQLLGPLRYCTEIEQTWRLSNSCHGPGESQNMGRFKWHIKLLLIFPPPTCWNVNLTKEKKQRLVWKTGQRSEKVNNKLLNRKITILIDRTAVLTCIWNSYKCTTQRSM